MTIEIPGPVCGKIEEVEPATADKPALLAMTIDDPLTPEKRAEVAAFKAEFDRWMAEGFRDWPAGCIVRGPVVAPFEIDPEAQYIGMDPEASR